MFTKEAFADTAIENKGKVFNVCDNIAPRWQKWEHGENQNLFHFGHFMPTSITRGERLKEMLRVAFVKPLKIFNQYSAKSLKNGYVYWGYTVSAFSEAYQMFSEPSRLSF